MVRTYLPPVGRAHLRKHATTSPVLGASASIMGRSSNLRPFIFANRSWGSFLIEPLPYPKLLRTLPASPAVLAYNPRWRSPPLFGISWSYRGGAMWLLQTGARGLLL